VEVRLKPEIGGTSERILAVRQPPRQKPPSNLRHLRKKPRRSQSPSMLKSPEKKKSHMMMLQSSMTKSTITKLHSNQILPATPSSGRMESTNSQEVSYFQHINSF
jgi:hypothetical protein